MYRVTYKKEGENPMTPIRKYQIEHCLECELPALKKGKTCDYDGMSLCVLINILNYTKELYSLKDAQMSQLRKDGVGIDATYAELMEKQSKK